MITPADVLLSLIFLSVLLTLSSNRLMMLVRVMGFQGVLVSLAPLLIEQSRTFASGSIAILSSMVLIKGVIIPAFLFLATKKVAIKREVEPFVSYHASIFIGLGIILMSVFISDRLQFIITAGHTLLLPAAFTTMAAGLFLLMARRKAITQVIGYLMLENGIYLVGTALAKQTHTQHVVEFGVLLDLLAGIMIMGIILHRINNTYDDLDTGFLGRLKDK